jgi:hypothetical protein
MADSKRSPVKFIAAGIAAVALIAAVLIPFVSITAQEEYTEMETRQESYLDVETRSEPYQELETKSEAYTEYQTKSEAYTDYEIRMEAYEEVEGEQVPYQTTEVRTESQVGFDDYTLQPGKMSYWSAYVPAGATVEYYFRASPTMDLYVVSESGMSGYPDRNSIRDNAIMMSENVETDREGFTTILAGLYYFVVHNGHDGFFTDREVAIYEANSKVSWEEEVTKYRYVEETVTKYREVEVPVTKFKDVQVPVKKFRDVQVPVTKYKDVQVPVTKYRDIEVPVVKVKDVPKNISLLEFLQINR